MTFPFNEIDPSVRTNVTHIEFDKSRAVKGVSKKPHKILVMGIMLTGTVAELTPKQINSGDQADAYFGVGSQIAEMCRAAKVANGQTEMWACGIVAATGGTAGTKTITFSGTSTAAGVIALYIGGRRVPVSIPTGTAAASVGPLVDTAIKAHKDYTRMAFTSGAATTVVTLTKRWKGIMDEDVRVNYLTSDESVPGLTSVVATAIAGATNPDVGSIITAIGDIKQYDTVINPWTDATNLTALEAELLARWNGMVQMEGFSYSAVVGSYGTASALGVSRNSPFVRLMAANTSPTPSYVWAAAVGAVNAYHSQIAPSRPRQTLAVPGVMPCAPEAQWGESDRNLLLFAGCSTHIDDGAGNVYLETMISTYRTNAAGVLDPSYLYAEKADTLAAIRYDLRSSVSLAFPRHMLAEDGGQYPQGMPVMTPKTMKGHAAGRYDLWVDQGWVDASKKQQFVDELVCEINSTNTERLSLQMGPSIARQFRGLDCQIQFII